MSKNKNCPNCGAVIEHIYSHKCPYCNTLLNSENVGTRQDINLRNVHNIELISIQITPRTYDLYLIFKGIESDIKPMFEVSNNKAVLFNKVQDVKFGLAIPIEELRNYNIFQLIESRVPQEILDEVMYSIEKYISKNNRFSYLFRF